MAVETMAAFDLFNLFVTYVFGGFWMAVIGLAVLMFIIMGVLGRISIYSATWYQVMFLLAMTLGYGYVIVNVAITVLMLIAFFFSWNRYIDNK